MIAGIVTTGLKSYCVSASLLKVRSLSKMRDLLLEVVLALGVAVLEAVVVEAVVELEVVEAVEEVEEAVQEDGWVIGIL